MAILEAIGAFLYLLNKVFFSVSERSDADHYFRWRANAWLCYMLGVVPVVIFYGDLDKWMVVCVELGAVPAMFYGYSAAKRGQKNMPVWLDIFAASCAVAGIGISFAAFGFFAEQTQYYELVLCFGFLVGTYLLAKEIPAGYFFFMLMIAANLAILWHEQKMVFFYQQVLSMCFVVDAYRIYARKHRTREGLS